MEEKNKFDIFISYRRDGGSTLAKLIYESLLQKRYSVFFDHDTLTSGEFGIKLIKTIEAAKDVIVVLSKNCLERCKNEDDWLRKEITTAINSNKNIILLFTEDFRMPSTIEQIELPDEIQRLLGFQGYKASIEHFDSIMTKLCNELDSSPAALDESALEPAIAFLSEGGAEHLPAETRKKLIKNLLTCEYGDSIGNVLNSYITSTAKNLQNIRTMFRYEIEIREQFFFNNIDIDEEKYFLLTENLAYKKQLVTPPDKNSFWLSFVRNLDELDDALRSENFLFSENLLMEKDDLKKLCELSDEEKLIFYTKNMRVKLNINGSSLTPTKLIINEAGIFANYTVKDSEVADNTLQLKLVFSIPHRKMASYFFVSISDPTYSPYIRFVYPEDEIDAEMIPFLSRATSSADTKIFEGLREISFEKEWVMPMSGVMFIITLDEK